MPNLEKQLQKAIVDIVSYRTSVEPTRKQIDYYVKAHSLLDILMPTTANKAWRVIDQQLESHYQITYR